MADIFDVLADATRRELLRTLLARYVDGSGSHGGDMSVGEIVVAMGLSQPTVSKHLKVLRDIHLVTVREQGQHRFYRLDYEPLETVEDWLLPFLSADYDGDDESVGMDEADGPALSPGVRTLAAHLGAGAGRISYSFARALSRLRRG